MKYLGRRRTSKPVPSSFRASFSQFRACSHSPEENEKTRRGTTQTVSRMIQTELALGLCWSLRNFVCVGFQCTMYKRVGEDTFNFSEQVRTGENCGADTNLFLIFLVQLILIHQPLIYPPLSEYPDFYIELIAASDW